MNKQNIVKLSNAELKKAARLLERMVQEGREGLVMEIIDAEKGRNVKCGQELLLHDAINPLISFSDIEEHFNISAKQLVDAEDLCLLDVHEGVDEPLVTRLAFIKYYLGRKD